MKKSFTLIEILLSLIILSILFLAMNNVLNGLKITKKILNNYYISQKLNELLIKTLYADLLNATSIKIIHSKNSDYDRIYMTTSNSLYHLIYPNVLWYVSKNNNTLIRVESPFNINLPNNKLFFLDKFDSNVKLFKIYRKDGKDLIIIKSNKPIYFEIIDVNFSEQSNETNFSGNFKNSNNLKNAINSFNSNTPTNLPTF